MKERITVQFLSV